MSVCRAAPRSPVIAKSALQEYDSDDSEHVPALLDQDQLLGFDTANLFEGQKP